MFGHKSFLRIGALNDLSISGLYNDGYELESCNFVFSQDIDKNGQPQNDVRGGTISLTYSGLPQNELLQWMLKPTTYNDGAIVVCNDSKEPVAKIFFQQAACVALDIDYNQSGESYIKTRIILQARNIRVGEVTLENNWTINK